MKNTATPESISTPFLIHHSDLPIQVEAIGMAGESEPGYDTWLQEKVAATLRRIESGATTLIAHDEAMRQLDARLKAGFAGWA